VEWRSGAAVILMLHGAGARGHYLDQADGADEARRAARPIVVSPLGFTPLGAYGNPLRLPGGPARLRPRYLNAPLAHRRVNAQSE
jgi:hypothetical protein